MATVGTPTLDQLRVFLAVVEAGSFAGAARRLHRATSVVSYTIANLETQLGLVLFDRHGTRKPQLTDAGRMVLAEARAILNGVDNLRARSRSILEGLEAELHVVIDVMLPEERLVDALTSFSERFPTVLLHLYVETLGAVTKLVLDRVATIGVTGPLEAMDGLERVRVGQVPMIPVAAPGHPLTEASADRPGAGRDHVQLVLTDRSELTRGREFAVMSSRTWRLGDLGAKHMLLKAGIGWGNMPEPMIRDDLAQGRLVRLEMPDTIAADYVMDVVYRTDTPPGPAGAWLVERFRAQAAADWPVGADPTR
ncbi:LysR family transcriptional regulator [Acuticoccus mangrovi]|uniref:LysR family transcriptional regulator n=1 Tax=Acuticoccus mangrovi TaxID=2796142 RepID=A0A934MHE0_9HYPH|nr:LysR family transcriptional regulator [Acuticoccus mangrovi]MBJ3775961.1 LysR family transcriptional regulator [Acuticoccus mangrovi]